MADDWKIEIQNRLKRKFEEDLTMDARNYKKQKEDEALHQLFF